VLDRARAPGRERVTSGPGAAGPARRSSWAHGAAAATVRDAILCWILGPIIVHYTRTRVSGLEHLREVRPPVVFAANHSSHLDTPVILRALPSEWRRNTAVAAAADYFYRNRALASVVSLAFGTVPIDRKAGHSRNSTESLNAMLERAGNVLMYPEGTRSRDGAMGVMRSGAGRLAVEAGVPLVPIGLTGTHEAMPPGRFWPRRHPVTVRFGAPLVPEGGEDHKQITTRLRVSIGELRALDDVP
jgi:1-acyl-sn-glycerol-3-phosphate acyltransferase